MNAQALLRCLATGLLAAITLWPLTAQAAPAAAPAAPQLGLPGTLPVSPAPLRLQWELLRNDFSAEQPDGRGQSRFILTNTGSTPLPASGWALYFTAIAGVERGPVPGHLHIDGLVGTWYRLRPEPGFQAVAPGQTIDIPIVIPEAMTRLAKAPRGPYLVWDAAPRVGHPIADYTLAPLTRPEQLYKGPNEPRPLLTPADVYQRNAGIHPVPAADLPPVFPRPAQWQQQHGSLTWSTMPRVDAAPALGHQASAARRLLQAYLPASPVRSADAGVLQLAVAPIAGQSSPEAYTLTVDAAQGVRITGATPAAVALGLQSLRDLLPLAPQPAQGVVLPALAITDAPRFAYRGLQMDVARNFQPKAVIFKLLDLMARYKLNTLHLHLTDDEGWRLQIAGLPELTEVGARRGHTLDSMDHLPPAYGSGPDVADPHGSGFYTAADYIEILRYAAALHITVVPEIEMPGHARAAVKAMESRWRRLQAQGHPQAGKFLLSDPQDQSVYRSAQLYTDHVINPGMASTYAFIDHVVGQLVALHRQAGVPLRRLHVGGDELPNGAWEKSPASAALMKQQGLAGMAELWDHFYSRVDTILRRHGLAGAGWEELGARKVKLRGQDKLIPNPRFVDRDFHLYVWNDTEGAEDLAYRLANAGYKTVLAPATHLYFDMAHNQNPEEWGVNWASLVDLDKVFDFIPFDFVRKGPLDATPLPGRDGLTDFGQHNILGLEATLFTETMRETAQIDHLLMPRLLAMAERAWVADPAWAREANPAKAQALHDADWSVFVQQLGQRVLPRLAHERPDVLFRIPPPGLKQVDGQVLVNHQLPGFTLRFTLDDSEPNATSTVLAANLMGDKKIIRVAAFDARGRPGPSARIDNRFDNR